MKSCYIWSEDLIHQCDRLPAVVGRASMVHSLIHGYGLINRLKIVQTFPSSYENLHEFHSKRYLEHLRTFTEVCEEYMASKIDEEHGIGYDCPPVSNMFDLVSTIAGGTVTAAKCLLLGEANVAINWCGGWHHAQRSGAEGFCYINDIVIGIEILRRKFKKVLYVDLDVHHGNGVQNAYCLSDSVFTLSFHKFEPGFYPGTGGLEDIGRLHGKGYCCNFPFHAGYSDETMDYAFDRNYLISEKYKLDEHWPYVLPPWDILRERNALQKLRNYLISEKYKLDEHWPYVLPPWDILRERNALQKLRVFNSVYSHFAPDAIVVQCGADALAHDPNGGGRLSIRGYCSCLKTVLAKKKPTMLLGGGGYNHANAARLWTSLTALVTETELDENIPEHRYWTSYGPDYTLCIQPTLAKDMNKKNYIDKSIATIQSNLEKYLPMDKLKGNKTENSNTENCDINKDFKSNPVDVYEFID